MAGNEKSAKVVVKRNGPYLVSGGLPLRKEIIVTDSKGVPVKWSAGKEYAVKEEYALCRCGQSTSKPYCDGTHVKVGFDGKETAAREFPKDAELTEGPGLKLADAESLCAFARFCHRAGGAWELVEKSGDAEAKKIAIEEVGDCPSGRLVVYGKNSDKAIEPKFKQSVGLVEDPVAGVSGPVWLKGGVLLESEDGRKYEVRNRMTLCRCGNSKNKPFCDGTHISVRFSDEE